MGESITGVQGAIDCFKTDLKEDRKYVKCCVGEEDCERVGEIGNRMLEMVGEAQQSHFEAFKATNNQFMYVSDSRQMDLKQKLASVVRRPVRCSGALERSLASSRDRTNLRGQVEARSADGADVRSPEADNPAVDESETHKQATDDSGAGN